MTFPPNVQFQTKTRRFLPQETPRFRFRIGLGSVMICVGCIVSDRKRLRKLPGGIFLRCFFSNFYPRMGFPAQKCLIFHASKPPRGVLFPCIFRQSSQRSHRKFVCFHIFPRKNLPGSFFSPIHRAILIASENGVKSQKRGGKTTKGALFLDFRHFYATFSAHSCRYCLFPSTNCVRFPERRRALLPLRGSISDFSPFAQKAVLIFI